MNILILSWRGPSHPLAGGAEIATYEHAKGWVKSGNHVILFTSAFENCKATENLDGIEIIRRGSDIFGVQLSAFLWYVFNSHPKFDLVVDEFHGIPFFTPLYVRTKKIGWIHEVTKEIWRLNPWPRPLNYVPSIFGTLFEPLVFKFIYHKVFFMTVSDSTKSDLINWGIPESNISVVHNGRNTISVNTKKEKKRTAIFLGAIAKDKGIEDAVRTFGYINKKDSNWQYWVVGQGTEEYLKQLKELSKNLKIQKNVKFWGFVDNKKKFELLSRSHVLINPSVREGWGLVNIEANSVGTPVVGYNVSGTRDSVINGKTGLLSKFGDPEALAKNAIGLCKNKDLYQTTSKEAKAWAKGFTWKKATSQSLKFLKKITNS